MRQSGSLRPRSSRASGLELRVSTRRSCGRRALLKTREPQPRRTSEVGWPTFTRVSESGEVHDLVHSTDDGPTQASPCARRRRLGASPREGWFLPTPRPIQRRGLPPRNRGRTGPSPHRRAACRGSHRAAGSRGLVRTYAPRRRRSSHGGRHRLGHRRRLLECRRKRADLELGAARFLLRGLEAAVAQLRVPADTDRIRTSGRESAEAGVRRLAQLAARIGRGCAGRNVACG